MESFDEERGIRIGVIGAATYLGTSTLCSASLVEEKKSSQESIDLEIISTRKDLFSTQPLTRRQRRKLNRKKKR
jgi:hypothetical protein